HVVIIALVLQAAIVRAPPAPPKDVALKRDAVFLLKPAELRKILGIKPPPPAAPKPPEPTAKDRISIGPPSPVRHEGLELHRDDDPRKTGKGPAKGSTENQTAQAPPPPATLPPAKASGPSVGEGGRLVATGPVRIAGPGPIEASLRRFEANVANGGA